MILIINFIMNQLIKFLNYLMVFIIIIKRTIIQFLFKIDFTPENKNFFLHCFLQSRIQLFQLLLIIKLNFFVIFLLHHNFYSFFKELIFAFLNV